MNSDYGKRLIDIYEEKLKTFHQDPTGFMEWFRPLSSILYGIDRSIERTIQAIGCWEELLDMQRQPLNNGYPVSTESIR